MKVRMISLFNQCTWHVINLCVQCVSDDPNGPCLLCIRELGAAAKDSCGLLSAEERRLKRGELCCSTPLTLVQEAKMKIEGDVVLRETTDGEAVANSSIKLRAYEGPTIGYCSLCISRSSEG